MVTGVISNIAFNGGCMTVKHAHQRVGVIFIKMIKFILGCFIYLLIYTTYQCNYDYQYDYNYDYQHDYNYD